MTNPLNYPAPGTPAIPVPPPAELIAPTRASLWLLFPLGGLGLFFAYIGMASLIQGSYGVFFGCIACSTVAVWVTYWTIYRRWVRPRRALVERCDQARAAELYTDREMHDYRTYGPWYR